MKTANGKPQAGTVFHNVPNITYWHTALLWNAIPPALPHPEYLIVRRRGIRS
jgi:hypothetical protein